MPRGFRERVANAVRVAVARLIGWEREHPEHTAIYERDIKSIKYACNHLEDGRCCVICRQLVDDIEGSEENGNFTQPYTA